MRWRLILPLLLSWGSAQTSTIVGSDVDSAVIPTPSSSSESETTVSSWTFKTGFASKSRIYQWVDTSNTHVERIIAPVNLDSINVVTLYGRESSDDKFVPLIENLRPDTVGKGLEYGAEDTETYIDLDISYLATTNHYPTPGVYCLVVKLDSSEDLEISPAFGISPNSNIDFDKESERIISEDNAADIALEGQQPSRPEDTTTTGTSKSDETEMSKSDDTGTSKSDETEMSKSDDTGAESGGGGLPVGAIVGIAVGAFAALVVIIALIWLMRRRKRAAAARHADASTPLAAGYPNTTAGRSADFMAEKETGTTVAESPHSRMYTDDPAPPSSRGTAMAGAAAGAGAASYAGGSIDRTCNAHGVEQLQTPPPPREESARGDMNSPVPSAAVARHLVEEDMTEDDIRRLEEEERELDRQIQEASRRK